MSTLFEKCLGLITLRGHGSVSSQDRKNDEIEINRRKTTATLGARLFKLDHDILELEISRDSHTDKAKQLLATDQYSESAAFELWKTTRSTEKRIDTLKKPKKIIQNLLDGFLKQETVKSMQSMLDETKYTIESMQGSQQSVDMESMALLSRFDDFNTSTMLHTKVMDEINVSVDDIDAAANCLDDELDDHRQKAHPGFQSWKNSIQNQLSRDSAVPSAPHPATHTVPLESSAHCR